MIKIEGAPSEKDKKITETDGQLPIIEWHNQTAVGAIIFLHFVSAIYIYYNLFFNPFQPRCNNPMKNRLTSSRLNVNAGIMRWYVKELQKLTAQMTKASYRELISIYKKGIKKRGI